jgi:hypothetical protein
MGPPLTGKNGKVTLVLGSRKESFLDRTGLDAIDATVKCRDVLVLQRVA